jgi:hypothetical protein
LAGRGLKEAFKAGDDVLDTYEDVRQRRYEWHSLNGVASLAELYERGNLVVHAHIGIRASLDEDEVGYWCALFEACPYVNVDITEVEAPHLVKSESLHFEYGADGLDDSVLVGVVNVMKQPQEVGYRLVPSAVRLEPLDECYVTRREILGKPESSFSAPIVITGGGDGEGQLIVGHRGLEQRQLPNQLIKGGPQVVRDIPDDYAPLLRRVGENVSPEDALVGLTVVIRHNSVRLIVSEALHSLLEGFEVRVRPVELETWTI